MLGELTGEASAMEEQVSRITRVSSPQVAEPPPGTWSNCLVVGGIAYVAGMVARGKEGSVAPGDEYDQAKLIFTKIRHLLEAAGGSMADVVKVTIFVTDIKEREKVWRARREFFTGDFPASTLVQVAALAEPALKVEIEAIAHIGAGAR
jgi:enamine deaminase RidA (YjgF/YER057c/UK114 family)